MGEIVTLKDVLLSVFPNVQTYRNNPMICPWYLGIISDSEYERYHDNDICEYFCGTCWDDKYSGKGSNLGELLYKNQVIDIFLNCAKDCNSVEELKDKFTYSVMDYDMFGRCE